MGYQDDHSPLQKEIDRAVRQRVLRGMELMKKMWGDRWVDMLDPSKLELSSGASCVLGQVYDQFKFRELPGDPEDEGFGYSDLNELNSEEGYTKGCIALGISSGSEDLNEGTAAYYGFMLAAGERNFTQLQWAWEEELAAIGLSGFGSHTADDE